MSSVQPFPFLSFLPGLMSLFISLVHLPSRSIGVTPQRQLLMALRSMWAPLFRFTSGHLLSYYVYNTIIKRLIQLPALDLSLYFSHSVQAGAATQAARSGLNPESIKGHFQKI